MCSPPVYAADVVSVWRGRVAARRQMVIIGLVLFGTSLEALQLLVPSRSFSIGDIFANTLGVLAGYALTSLTRKMRRPSR